jgi:hypothetical protein
VLSTKSEQRKTCAMHKALLALTIGLAGTLLVGRAMADTFVKPTAEELKMTSLPGYPGAPAVVLFEEESTTDKLHVHQIYRRVKILTEEGKSYANVELRFLRYDNSFGDSNSADITNIEGRTIHPDGTIIPFTGKPYLKMIEDSKHVHYQARVFTLPDVEIGSIIEYRYASRFDDSFVEAPQWIIQGDLFVKSAHYIWTPTTRDLIDGDSGNPISTISWFPILPPDAKIEVHQSMLPESNGQRPNIYELRVHDIPPIDKEDFMPPIGNFSYRVLFSYTAFRGGDEYWKVKGKAWSKRSDTFIGPSSDLRNETQKIIAGATTDDQKLRKIYAAVMELDNTSYTRDHAAEEDKAAGLRKINNAGDVLTNKRGSASQINSLFIGMARAAGLKAYRMIVTDRENNLFAPAWLNFDQLNSDVAVVILDGKENYFDPGARYCEYAHLTWGDTDANGIRQSDNGAIFASTPGEPYTNNAIGRAANLHVDAEGQITGGIVMNLTGAPALRWRRVALEDDTETMRKELREYMEARLPKTLEVKLLDVKNTADYEHPLTVSYSISGSMGTFTGKRMLLPVDPFQMREVAAFPNEKRVNHVYFEYPHVQQDAIRIFLPQGFVVEAAPQSINLPMADIGFYKMEVTQAAGSVTVRRSYAFNTIAVMLPQYPALRTFYSKFESDDKQSLVLKQAAPAASAPPAGGQ